MQILFLPKWYPNKLDPFDGNFVENHAHAISKIAQVKVLFVHSDPAVQKGYAIEEKKNRELFELRVYFKKANTRIGILNKIISFFRYRKAQIIGFRKLYPNQKPDLVHVHVLSRPAILALRLNIPFIITEHWSGYLPANGKYKGFLKKKFSEFVVRKSKGVHTVSSQLMEAMKSHKLINKYWVIPNVVDTSQFKLSEQEHKNRKCTILFVGNLLQRPKRILDIIEAAAKLREKHENFELHLYGEGKDEGKAKRLINSLGAEKYIHLMGTRDRAGIAKAMSEASFLVLFSDYENQPCVIPESHASGIPIIVPSLPGIAERMNKQLGIEVPVGDKEALLKAMEQMLMNYDSYSKEYIRNYAEDYFSENTIASQFKSIYEDILTLEG